MDLRKLRYFTVVYEELNLSKAAKRCFISQPSLSSAIQQLENKLECKLFIRHAKGVSPTRAGEILYSQAHKVMNEIKSVQNLFKSQIPLLPFKIALMPFLSGKRIGLIVKALLDCVQGLDLEIVDWTDEADARIISKSMLRKDETFYELWQEEYILALPVGHTLAKQESVLLEQLDGVPFVSRTFCDVLDPWNFAVQKRGIHINRKARVNVEEYALDIVAAGLGVSLVPSHSVANRSDIVTRKLRDTRIERIVGFAYKSDHPIPFQLFSALEQGMS